MKKYFFFLVILCADNCYSQKKLPIIFSSVDAMAVYPPKYFEIDVPSYSLINAFTSVAFGRKLQYGLFAEVNYEPSAFRIDDPKVFSILPGALIAGRTNNVYVEFGAGPGFQTRKNKFGSEKIIYVHEYGYIETKSDQLRAKGKLVLSETYAALPDKYGKWYLAYAIYYPFNRTIGVGVHAQSYGTWGGRIQYLFKGESPRKILWVAGGSHDISLGISLAKQWTKGRQN